MNGTTKPWLTTMRQITGTHALHDNPVILGWAKKIGEVFPEMASYSAQYTHDTIAWCGLTVGYCMASNGIRPVFGAGDTQRFLFAQSWLQFGTAASSPQPGDVLVFNFGGGDHHVTLYEQTQGNSYVCRGGNQSHQVKLSNYPKSQCIGVRRPPAASVEVEAPTTAQPAVQMFSGITATVFAGSADPNVSAYDGHVIDDSELGVALPYRFPGTRPNVCVWNGGKSVVCKIVDVGPWNTNDPYWQTGARPEAETGVDSQGRPTNHAGIDMTPATALALGIKGKGTVDWEFTDAGHGAPQSLAPAAAAAATLAPDLATPAAVAALASKSAAATPSPPAPNLSSSGLSSPTLSTPGHPAPASAQGDVNALLQQVLGLVQAFRTLQAPSASPTTDGSRLSKDQIAQVTNVLNAFAGLTGVPSKKLGPVNGVLGQTVGNFLSGKKTAIGVVGALGTHALSQASGGPLGTIASDLGGASALSGIGMPAFLAITLWGVLGKMEKWSQGAAQPGKAS